MKNGELMNIIKKRLFTRKIDLLTGKAKIDAETKLISGYYIIK